MNAAIGEDVALAVSLAAPLRRHAHDREVRGAATDVDDQHQLLARHLLLIIERRCNRLVLERDVPEALLARDLLQCGLRLGIGRVVLVDEAHRAAEHDLIDLLAEPGFDLRFQMREEEAENAGERHRLLADVGLLVDQRGAENALQRAHEAAVMAGQVALDCAAPELHAVILEIEEHRARQGAMLPLQRDQLCGGVIAEADRGVRSAEVDAAIGRCRHARLVSSPGGRSA